MAGGLVIRNFKGRFGKASPFDLPDVLAEECKDFLPTYEGKLVKRSGYEAATLNGVAFAATGLAGNIISMVELVTGRDTTTAPNEAVKYLCQTDDGYGKVYVWTESTPTWTRIDNSLTDFRDAAGTVKRCRWMVEDGVIRILAGNRSVNKPLWWGYCGERFTHAISANAGTKTPVSGAFLTNAVVAELGKPAVGDYVAVTAVSKPAFATWENALSEIPPNDGSTYVAFYFYQISIQYDNKQWSPPSKISLSFMADINYAASSDFERVKVLVSVDGTTFNRRLTGIKIYRSRTEFLGAAKSEYNEANLIASIQLAEDYGSFTSPNNRVWPYNSTYLAGVYNSSTLQFKLSASQADDDSLANDLFNGALLLAQDTITSTVYTCQVADTIVTDADNQYFQVTSTTGLTNGRTYNLMVVRGWVKNGDNYQYLFVDDLNREVTDALPTAFEDLGISQDNYTVTYPKYGVMINGQAFYFNAHNYGESKSYIGAYGMLTRDGTFANDVQLVLNAFTVGMNVKGASAIGDRLIVYGDTAIIRGIIPASNESSWDFERVFEQYGLLAEESLINVHGRDYFLASDWDIKVFDGVTKPVSIGAGIYDVLRAAGEASIAYLQATKVVFVPLLNMVVFMVQTGASSYQYWGYDVSGELGWVQFQWADTFSGFFVSKTGEAFAFDANECWKLNNGTTDDGTAITPSYTSRPLAADNKAYMHLREILMAYKSSNAAQMKVYMDGAAAVSTLLTLAAQILTKMTEYQPEIGCEGRHLKFTIDLPTTSQAANTQLEVDEVEFVPEVSGG